MPVRAARLVGRGFEGSLGRTLQPAAAAPCGGGESILVERILACQFFSRANGRFRGCWKGFHEGFTFTENGSCPGKPHARGLPARRVLSSRSGVAGPCTSQIARFFCVTACQICNSKCPRAVHGPSRCGVREIARTGWVRLHVKRGCEAQPVRRCAVFHTTGEWP